MEVNLTGSNSYQRICEINRPTSQPIEVHIHSGPGKINPCTVSIQGQQIEAETSTRNTAIDPANQKIKVHPLKASLSKTSEKPNRDVSPRPTKFSVNSVQPESSQCITESRNVVSLTDKVTSSDSEYENQTLSETTYEVNHVETRLPTSEDSDKPLIDLWEESENVTDGDSNVNSAMTLISENDYECKYAVNVAQLDAKLTVEQVHSLSKPATTSPELGAASLADVTLVAQANLSSTTDNLSQNEQRMSTYANQINQQNNEISDLSCELLNQQKILAEKEALIQQLTAEVNSINGRNDRIRETFKELVELKHQKIAALYQQIEELNSQNEELRRKDHKFKHSSHWNKKPKSVHFEDESLPHEGELNIKLCSGRTYVIPGEIQTKTVEMILDTAAQVSCISKDFFDTLQGPIRKEAQATLRGIGDTPVESFRVSLPVQFGTQQQLRPFYVVSHESPILLGLDFIMDNCGIVDTQKEIVTFNGEEIPMILVCNKEEKFKISRVAVIENQYLPPNSHTQVAVKFNRPLSEKEVFLIEHNKSKTPYLVANTLVKGGRKAFVSVINDSDTGVTLKQNFHIGTAKEVQSVELVDEQDCDDEDQTTDWSESSVRQYIANLEAVETPVDAYGKPIRVSTDSSTPDAKSSIQLESTSQRLGSNWNMSPTSGPTLQSQSNTTFKEGSYDDSDDSEGSDTTSPPSEEEWERRLKVVYRHMPDYLTKLFTDSCVKLTVAESTKFGILLLKYQDRFSAHDFDLGCIKGVSHKIDTGDHAPLKQPLRRTILSQMDKEKDCIEKLMKAGIIIPSKSEWASPPLLVKKADGGTRFCIDYRELNKRTIKDSYPLPLIEDCLDVLANNVYFSRCDMSWGYHQILMDPDSASKTAFNSRFGLFQYQFLPFGLTNAPATFQRAMNLILKGLTWSCVLAYLDDVMVLGKSFMDHMSNLEKLFKRFRTFQAKLKPSKCLFFQTETEFLGKVISQEGVRVSPDKVKAVQEWPLPETKRQLQSFLGFINYHREHIENFAALTADLYELSGPKTEFVWTEKHTSQVAKLKELITKAPCLAYPLSEGQYILDCDASATAIGAVLSQVQPDGSVRPISFASNVLLKEQRNYCITRRELLSVVKFTRHFRHYLLGRDVLVRTDHSSLAWLMNFCLIEGQLARWLEELSRFNITFRHRKGQKHVNADSMSRIPDNLTECANASSNLRPEDLPCYPCRYCQRAHDQWSEFKHNVDDIVPIDTGDFRVAAVQTEKEEPEDEDFGLSSLFANTSPMNTEAQAGHTPNQSETSATETTSPSATPTITTRTERTTPHPNWVDAYTPADLRKLQLDDPKIQPIILWLEGNRHPTQQELFIESPFTKKLWETKNLLVMKNGVLYYEWLDVVKNRFLLVVPSSCKADVMRNCHDIKAAGHMGIDKSIQRTKQSFYWPGMGKDIRLYVQSCHLCNRYKKFTNAPKAKQVIYHAGAPMERIHLDILGPFQKTARDNLYVLVMIDQFSKWPECVALPEASAEEIALAFLVKFVAYFGCPLIVHTDQGSNFDGNVFKALCRMMEIIKTRTTPYHPESNAQCETKNRIILQMIRIFCDGRPKDWDYQLPFLCMALRATRSRSTGFTPNMLMLGREVHSPYEIVYGLETETKEAQTKPQWVQTLQQHLESAHAFAREHLKSALHVQKRYFDLRARDRTFKKGDYVMKKSITTKRGPKALKEVWTGPFLVLEARHPLFTIQKGKREQILHLNRLRICRDRKIPVRLQLRRQELFNLDETIAYDEEELDPKDLAPALPPTATRRAVRRRQTRTMPTNVNIPPNPTEARDIPRDVTEPVVQPTTTRAGRITRQPKALSDYIR